MGPRTSKHLRTEVRCSAVDLSPKAPQTGRQCARLVEYPCLIPDTPTAVWPGDVTQACSKNRTNVRTSGVPEGGPTSLSTRECGSSTNVVRRRSPPEMDGSTPALSLHGPVVLRGSGRYSQDGALWIAACLDWRRRSNRPLAERRCRNFLAPR